MKPLFPGAAGLVLVASAPAMAEAQAPVPAVAAPYYSIQLTLQGDRQSLLASTRIRLIPQKSGLERVKLRLHSALKVSRVTLNDRPVRSRRVGELLEVDLPRGYKVGQKLVLAVSYAGRPTESIGGKRLQDLRPDFAVLHPKGRWYPQLAESAPTTADVHVRLPIQWRVTGPSQRTTGGGTLFHLSFSKPGPLALVAGRYQVFNAAGLTTYTRPKTAVESELRAGADLLALYRAKGLGFGGASGTLIELPEDFRALVLPGFQARPIATDGLAEWVALAQWTAPNPSSAEHIERQWLGHSLIAFSRDLLAEKRGGKYAYQRAMQAHLQAYQEFIREKPGADVPLGQPIDPDSPAWEPVVLHKGALIWGLLRDQLGDKALWDALKHYRSQLATRQATISIFHEALGRRTDFLYSWLANTGLPAMRFAGVRVEETEGGYQVSGKLVQAGAELRLPLELALIAKDGVQRVSFQSFAAEMPFHFVTRSKPLRLVLDPDERRPLVRRNELLVPDGIAPVDGVIVYGTGGTDAETQACLETARKLQERLRKYKNLYLPIRADAELTAEERKRSLLLFGRPGINSVAAQLENQFPVRFIRGQAIWWQGRVYQHPHHGTVQIIANPEAPAETVVLFAAMSPEGMPDVLRYTQQPSTFCVFDAGEVLAEGRTLRAFPDLEAVLY